MKISDIDKQEFEASWSGNATLQGDIPVWDHMEQHKLLQMMMVIGMIRVMVC